MTETIGRILFKPKCSMHFSVRRNPVGITNDRVFYDRKRIAVKKDSPDETESNEIFIGGFGAALGAESATKTNGN